MSESAIQILRVILLAAAVGAFLQATLLAGWTRRRILKPLFAQTERAGGQVPRLMRDERMLRVWSALMAIVFAILWWYFGTGAGQELLQQPGR